MASFTKEMVGGVKTDTFNPRTHEIMPNVGELKGLIFGVGRAWTGTSSVVWHQSRLSYARDGAAGGSNATAPAHQALLGASAFCIATTLHSKWLQQRRQDLEEAIRLGWLCLVG